MLFTDTEFNRTSEALVRQVCAAVYDSKEKKLHKFWMHGDLKEQLRFKEFCESKKDETWFSYAVTAEGRYFLSSQLDPVGFKWIDGYLEYRCISNHNDRIAYGPQLVNGKVRMTRRPPPKWERSEDDSASAYKQTFSLAEATYKLCGVIRDTEHKNLMRDIIIRGDFQEIEDNKHDILEYCVEDTIYLPKIYNAIIREYKDLLEPDEMRTLQREMLKRGEYAALTACMESYGYPIHVDKTKNFSNSVKSIIEECQREINTLFPNIKPFKWKKLEGTFSWDQISTRKWIRENVPGVERWKKTDKGDISLALDAFQRFFDFTHSYPKDNFGAQMVRYLKLKQNMNGFSYSPKKRNFWDYVGSDGRVRPWMNIFGAQSGRSQPAATGFLFLKPAWMRSLCEPAYGKAIASFDYGSQEFLISALVSKDPAMIDAYKSGDIYLAFGKAIGLIPKNGTKKTHEKERNLCKAAVLGISYLMTKIGLAAKLSADLKREVTEEEAQELIDLFYAAYPEFAQWQEDTIFNYMRGKEKLGLPCGWKLFPDNDNHRSAANFPIQGFGASIMRHAVKLCHDAGLKVIFTLHDAIYIEYDVGDTSAIDKLHKAMLEGFLHYFEDKKSAALIRLDGKTWSPNYEDDTETITPNGLKISTSKIFIDERSQEEYDTFSKYFEDPGIEFL